MEEPSVTFAGEAEKKYDVNDSRNDVEDDNDDDKDEDDDNDDESASLHAFSSSKKWESKAKRRS